MIFLLLSWQTLSVCLSLSLSWKEYEMNWKETDWLYHVDCANGKPRGSPCGLMAPTSYQILFPCGRKPFFGLCCRNGRFIGLGFLTLEPEYRYFNFIWFFSFHKGNVCVCVSWNLLNEKYKIIYLFNIIN